jgi:hypothetical protein
VGLGYGACDSSFSFAARTIRVFAPRCQLVLCAHVFRVFGIGRLKQLILKMSIFGVGCLRRPKPKIDFIFVSAVLSNRHKNTHF